jgi:hypothetical protein
VRSYSLECAEAVVRVYARLLLQVGCRQGPRSLCSLSSCLLVARAAHRVSLTSLVAFHFLINHGRLATGGLRPRLASLRACLGSASFVEALASAATVVPAVGSLLTALLRLFSATVFVVVVFLLSGATLASGLGFTTGHRVLVAGHLVVLRIVVFGVLSTVRYVLLLQVSLGLTDTRVGARLGLVLAGRPILLRLSLVGDGSVALLGGMGAESNILLLK